MKKGELFPLKMSPTTQQIQANPLFVHSKSIELNSWHITMKISRSQKAHKSCSPLHPLSKFYNLSITVTNDWPQLGFTPSALSIPPST